MGLIYIATKFNGWGLSKDAVLLKNLLLENGHDVGELDVSKNRSLPKGDILIHLEIISGINFSAAKHQVLIPNPEWFPKQWLTRKNRFTSCLVKNEYGKKVFTKLGFKNVENVGFTSEDHYLPNVKKENFALHLAGNSTLKNTVELVKHWKENWPELRVFTTNSGIISQIKQLKLPSNIVLHTDRISDEDVIELQNRALYIIQPSEAEGFGHCIAEPLSIGNNFVVTTDGKPMNEFKPCILLPSYETGYHHYGIRYNIKNWEKLERVFKRKRPVQSRDWWLKKDEEFKTNFINQIERILHD